MEIDQRAAARTPGPVLITGMHRSGTSLVSRLLEQVGLFIGDRVDQNHESIYFIEIDDELFRRCGATWDHPAAMGAFVEMKPFADLTARCLEADLQSRQVRRYLGWRHFLRYRRLGRLQVPWGWKNPRLVFTLPLWLGVFPAARVVYVTRDGIDVAASLVERERQNLERLQGDFERRFARKKPGGKLERAGFHGSVRCLSLDGAFSLWEEYVARGESMLEAVESPVLRIRYEDLASEPTAHLARLVEFCGLGPVAPARLVELASSVESARIHAWRSSASLVSASERFLTSPWMKALGHAEPTGPLGAGPSGSRV